MFSRRHGNSGGTAIYMQADPYCTQESQSLATDRFLPSRDRPQLLREMSFSAPGTRETAAASITSIATLPCGPRFYDYNHDPHFSPSSCLPTSWDAYWSRDLGYYSPALCFSGWSIGCTRLATTDGPEVAPDETAYECVPRYETL